MQTPQPSLGRLIALMLIGAGLISIAVAAYELNKDYFDIFESSETEFSAVPEQVNYPAPDLKTMTDLDGNPVSLEDYRGSVVLVNLWATWCPPCRAEMPALEAFHQKYKDDGFVLIGIDEGEPLELVAPFVEEYGLTFPIWLDLDYEAEQKFKTNALPSSYVIDRKGKVRLTWVGGISEENLEYYVPEIIYNY